MALPDTWPARLAAAAAKAAAANAAATLRPLGGAGAGDSRGGRDGSSRRRSDSRAALAEAAAEDRALLRPRGRQTLQVPLWPPPFEDDGAAWVFDPASSYFGHAATGYFYEPKAKWYGKRDPASGAFAYFRHAPGQTPPFARLDTHAASAAPQQQQPGASAAPSQQPQPRQQQQQPAAAAAASATSAAALAAEGAAALAAAEALARREAAKASKGALSAAARKTLSAISGWNERAEKEAAAPDVPAAQLPAAGRPAPAAASALPKAQAVRLGPAGGGGGGLEPLLLTLGTDYATVGKLGLQPEGAGTPSSAAPGPLAEGSGSKWACLVSRRAFATEEQLAKHIRLSQLYRDELAKAIAQGRVVLLPN
jgi:hypothetical protein